MPNSLNAEDNEKSFDGLARRKSVKKSYSPVEFEDSFARSISRVDEEIR